MPSTPKSTPPSPRSRPPRPRSAPPPSASHRSVSPLDAPPHPPLSRVRPRGVAPSTETEVAFAAAVLGGFARAGQQHPTSAPNVMEGGTTPIGSRLVFPSSIPVTQLNRAAMGPRRPAARRPAHAMSSSQGTHEGMLEVKITQLTSEVRQRPPSCPVQRAPTRPRALWLALCLALCPTCAPHPGHRHNGGCIARGVPRHRLDLGRRERRGTRPHHPAPDRGGSRE